ncbi:GyrI-like domain-containing protein [Marinicrinis sediminis]|uniref:GyrI-like domain-containing protein n=1 Tax=Marinicrinis sediminis TaxID=1652465 RepID=A0ABW5REC6_9BACL
MEQVTVTGVQGVPGKKEGFRGVGHKVVAPFSELGTKIREAKDDVLKQVKANSKMESQPLLYCISPPEKISSMEDDHTVYVLVKEESFGEQKPPESFIQLDVPTQSCLHFHYEGSMNDIMSFYQELFSRISGDGDIPFDQEGYRIEEYGENHKWDDKETEDNELEIFFPVQAS